MKQNRALPPLTTDCLEAFTASAWAWLMWLACVIARIGVTRRTRRLDRFVCRLERGVESILFLQAVHRFAPPPRVRRRPGSAPPGFRRQCNARHRQFFRNAGVRARKSGLAARLAALVAALAAPERAIAYFYARLLRGLRGAGLVIVAPPTVALAAGAPRAPVTADTS